MGKHNAISNWGKSARYSAFKIGTSDENGAHLRNFDGVSYSVYRQGFGLGVTDVVIADGIQSFEDARVIRDLLNARNGFAVSSAEAA
jgi:hypothetical protein